MQQALDTKRERERTKERDASRNQTLFHKHLIVGFPELGKKERAAAGQIQSGEGYPTG
jgi:hypothetical protein